MSIARFPIQLGVPKVGVPGYSGHMKHKARKKQLLAVFAETHVGKGCRDRICSMNFAQIASALKKPHQHLFLLLALRRPGPAAGEEALHKPFTGCGLHCCPVPYWGGVSSGRPRDVLQLGWQVLLFSVSGSFLASSVLKQTARPWHAPVPVLEL